jgi:hypothetical protein
MAFEKDLKSRGSSGYDYESDYCVLPLLPPPLKKKQEKKEKNNNNNNK